MTVTVQQMVDEVRGISGLRRSTYYSDIEISEFIADGGSELADIFIDAHQAYFQTSFDFTLAGGLGHNSVALPDDFQKENLLLLDPTLDTPTRVPFLGSQFDRGSTSPGVFLWPGGGRRAYIADQTLEVLPPSMAAGNYRLLYTPQFASLAFPRTPDFTVGVATVPGSTGAGFSMTPSGSEPGTTWACVTDNPWILNGVTMSGLSPPFLLLRDRPNPAQNGVFVKIAQGPGTATLQRYTSVPGKVAPFYPTKGQTTLVTGGTLGAGYYVQTNTPAVLDTDAISIVQTPLPAVLTPWQRFLKVYASLAVRTGRGQPAVELAGELEMLKKRITKASANRTAEPRQAPITRSRLMYGLGPGGWK